MKELEKFVEDKPELNLISKKEVSLLKKKLGKSHRGESDWDIIKNILLEHSVITFTLPKRAKGLKMIEKVLCEDGALVVFTNLNDCTRHIQELQLRGRFQGMVEIGSIPFEDVLDIAHLHHRNILIDLNCRANTRCFLYEYKEQRIKAVILQ